MTQQTDVSIEYKVAAMEAELSGLSLTSPQAVIPMLLWNGDEDDPEIIDAPLNHRTPEGREWFCEHLTIQVYFKGGHTGWWIAELEKLDLRFPDFSRSRAIQLAIEAEAERRWKEREG